MIVRRSSLQHRSGSVVCPICFLFGGPGMDCADGGSGLFRLVLCGDCAPGSAGVSSRVFCPVGTSCVCGASLIVDSFFSASSCPLTSSHTTHQLLEQEFAGSGSGSGEGALLLPLDHVRPRVERFSRVVNEVMRTPSQQLFRFVLGSRPWSLRERERERERELVYLVACASVPSVFLQKNN